MDLALPHDVCNTYLETSCSYHLTTDCAHYGVSNVDPLSHGDVECFDAHGNPCIEVYFTRDMAKVAVDDSHMQPGDIAVMQVLLAGTKQMVIKRDTDLLTAAELR